MSARIARLRLASFAVLASLAPACASRQLETRLKYMPIPRLEARALPAAHVRSGHGPVLLGTFVDEREDPRDLGLAYEAAWTAGSAAVRTSDRAVDWMRDAVRLELERAGWEVGDVATRSSPVPGESSIRGAVHGVRCTLSESCRGELSLSVLVRRDGSEVLNREYVGRASVERGSRSAAAAASEALCAALQNALRLVVADLALAVP